MSIAFAKCSYIPSRNVVDYSTYPNEALLTSG